MFWVIAVGCSMHAMIDAVQRVLSLAGLHDVRYPASVWASIDTRAADLQDLCFNEPWFLFEGLGFALLAWIAMGPGQPRRVWIGSALAATGALDSRRAALRVRGPRQIDRRLSFACSGARREDY